MDHKGVALMMPLCFLIMLASVATTTADDYSTSGTHREDDYLSNRMAGGLTSHSQDSVWNGRYMLEESHGFPPVSMDRHEKRDLAALLSFKKHIKSDPSGMLSNWTPHNSKEVCSWFGITCRQHTRRVVAIILPISLSNDEYREFGMQGTLSPALGNLSLLHKLNLSGNNLTGGIPPELGHLKALRILDLSVNSWLGGSIPKSLFNCTRLRWISITDNSLGGTIPTDIGRLVELEHLDLSFNWLSGKIPTSLSNCTSLQELSIAFNNYNGSIPSILGLMRSLSYLDVSGNNFSGHISSALGNYTQLLHIDFSGNYISGRIPAEFRLLQKLEFLDLSSNKLENTIPLALGNCSSLKYLYLGNNPLSGSIPSQLGNLRQLTELSIFGPCNGCIFRSGNNEFDDDEISSYCHRGNISGSIPSELGNCSSLSFLYLGFNSLIGSIPEAITKLTKLKWLSIPHNNRNRKASFPSTLGFKFKQFNWNYPT